MAVLNPNQTPLLSRSHPIKLGTVTAAGNQLNFAMPSGDSYSYRGQLILMAVNVGGGPYTVFTATVKAALDGGSGPTFNLVPSGTVDLFASPLQRVDMSGLGAISCQLTVATLTLNGATSVDIWATCG